MNLPTSFKQCCARRGILCSRALSSQNRFHYYHHRSHVSKMISSLRNLEPVSDEAKSFLSCFMMHRSLSIVSLGTTSHRRYNHTPFYASIRSWQYKDGWYALNNSIHRKFSSSSTDRMNATKKPNIPKKKKKLKTNQLGQKGQNLRQMKIDKINEKKKSIRANHSKNKNSKTSIKKRIQVKNQKFVNSIQNPLGPPQLLDEGEGEQDPQQPMMIPPPQLMRPPALLLPTSSKNVFVAKIACEQFHINRHAMFAHMQNDNNGDHPASSSLFRKGYFEHFPNATYELSSSQQPEVAFLGRSNVGKSSLINALIRRPLAITSKQPGRTQQAYYYGFVRNGTTVADASMGKSSSNRSGGGGSTPSASSINIALQQAARGFIVDLPGYGYAVGPNKVVEEWQKKTQEFLLMRRDSGNLKQLFLLQDARTGVMPLDQSVMNWMDEASIPYTIVITKVDCVSPSTIIKHANLACIRYHHRLTDMQDYVAAQRRRMPIDDDSGSDHTDSGLVDGISMGPVVYTCSANDNVGIAELLSTIEKELKL